jgi:hypothetical protein
LIEIQSGFLTADQIDRKNAMRGGHGKGCGFGAMEHTGAQLHAFGGADGGVVALDDTFWSTDLAEGGGDEVAALIHGQSQGLHDAMRPVTINDQSRQAVTFGPNHAVDSCRRLAGEEALAIFKGPANAPGEKLLIKFLFTPGKPPGHDLALGVVNSRAQRLVFLINE